MISNQQLHISITIYNYILLTSLINCSDFTLYMLQMNGVLKANLLFLYKCYCGDFFIIHLHNCIYIYIYDKRVPGVRTSCDSCVDYMLSDQKWTAFISVKSFSFTTSADVNRNWMWAEGKLKKWLLKTFFIFLTLQSYIMITR